MYYNGANSYLFVHGTEIIKFKGNDFEIVATPLCLGNVSNNLSADNMKKTGFDGYVYDLSVDYDSIVVNDTLDIHNYVMEKAEQKIMFGFIKKIFVTAVSCF